MAVWMNFSSYDVIIEDGEGNHIQRVNKSNIMGKLNIPPHKISYFDGAPVAVPTVYNIPSQTPGLKFIVTSIIKLLFPDREDLFVPVQRRFETDPDNPNNIVMVVQAFLDPEFRLGIGGNKEAIEEQAIVRG